MGKTHLYIAIPPSTRSTAPVIYSALMRNITASATSSGLPALLSGTAFKRSGFCFRSSFVISVSMNPGATALHGPHRRGSGPAAGGQTLEILPKSILFWRSFTHWIGGMGIVVFAIALLPSLGLNGQTIAGVETPGPTLDKISPKMSDTAKSLYLTYSIFTVVQIVLLYLGGMNLFDSCVHSFGSMGTGGFSDYNLSIGHFHNAYIDTIIIIFMLLSGASFNLHVKAIKYGPKVYTKDIELRTYLFIFLIASLIIMIDLKVSGTYSSLTEAADKVSFQVTSILTTTGYNNANYDLWPSLSKMVLFLLMFIGGCSCSTGGGVKVIRIIILIQYIRRGIALRLHPNAVVEVKINGRKVQSETIRPLKPGFILEMHVFTSSEYSS